MRDIHSAASAPARLEPRAVSRDPTTPPRDGNATVTVAAAEASGVQGSLTTADPLAALREISQGNRASTEKLISSVSATLADGLRGIGGSDTRANDKVNAFAGLKYEQNLLVLKDCDIDFERHWLQFQSILGPVYWRHAKRKHVTNQTFYLNYLPSNMC